MNGICTAEFVLITKKWQSLFGGLKRRKKAPNNRTTDTLSSFSGEISLVDPVVDDDDDGSGSVTFEGATNFLFH